MQIFRESSWAWGNSPSLLMAMHWKTRRLTAHVAKARVSLLSMYLACIHMQILIDITTFTYCIFASGHILAYQFPIVGFRPPVHLIDIIGRAADTRLHFYLHIFSALLKPDDFFNADKGQERRSSSLAFLVSIFNRTSMKVAQLSSLSIFAKCFCIIMGLHHCRVFNKSTLFYLPKSSFAKLTISRWVTISFHS